MGAAAAPWKVTIMRERMNRKVEVIFMAARSIMIDFRFDWRRGYVGR